MQKYFSKGMAILMKVALFGFVAFFNAKFFTGLMPAGYEIVGYLGLFALDFGAIAWYSMFQQIDQGNAQRSLALFVFGADLVGAIVSMIAELIHMAAMRGEVAAFDPATRWIMLVITGLVVGVNVASLFSYVLLSPDLMSKIKEAQLNDTIREKRDDERFKAAGTLAQKWAAEENAAWIAQMQHSVDRRNQAVYESLRIPQVVDSQAVDVRAAGSVFERLFRRAKDDDSNAKIEAAMVNVGAVSAPSGPSGAVLSPSVELTAEADAKK